MIIKRVAVVAAVLVLGREEEVAILAAVALQVEAPVQGHHANSLLSAAGGHDGLMAHGAFGCKAAVEAWDAVDLVGSIRGERHSVE